MPAPVKIKNAGLPIGSTVRKIRHLRGMIQRLEAIQLGMSFVHLCKIEKGHVEPSPTTVARIRETWGVDIYVLAWLRREYETKESLTDVEAAQLAKNLLCRGMGREFTRREVEEFLEKDD